MLPISLVQTHSGEFPKLSKSNSIAIDGLLFYIKKVGNIYVAYEYKTKLQIIPAVSKEKLIQWIENNIKRIKDGIKEAY